MIVIRALNGACHTRTPSFLNFVVFWMLQIPLAYWLATSVGMGPNGVFTAIVVSESALTLLGVFVFRRGKRRTQEARTGTNAMNDLARQANIAEIVGVIVVVGGLFFALLQMRQIRQQRRELAAIKLFRFFGNPQFTAAYKTILRLPDGLTADDIRAGEAGLEDAAVPISATMENIGVMTYQRIVPFTVVNNLMGASAPLLWHKLEKWAVTLREEQGSPEAFEWFQWPVERLEDYHAFDPDPAYVAHKDWMPSHLRHHIGS